MSIALEVKILSSYQSLKISYLKPDSAPQLLLKSLIMERLYQQQQQQIHINQQQQSQLQQYQQQQPMGAVQYQLAGGALQSFAPQGPTYSPQQQQQQMIFANQSAQAYAQQQQQQQLHQQRLVEMQMNYQQQLQQQMDNAAGQHQERLVRRRDSDPMFSMDEDGGDGLMENVGGNDGGGGGDGGKRKKKKEDKVPFTPEEDSCMLTLVQIHGVKKWGLIADLINQSGVNNDVRTAKICRERPGQGEQLVKQMKALAERVIEMAQSFRPLDQQEAVV
ncbi:hypothetical protein FGO68_gene11228 [Halteria grandinella]|uniref:Myb-like domain-containing protein n=1 Tax=Halteria grandinella TaxID=5974 RepID=A0A8J8T845_HALGN|nr:hypothetical protein FGO68_gene11228 [Halteria grandinella]